jgi:hypothetical protein
MPSDLSLEMIMRRNIAFSSIAVILLILVLSACNLPERQTTLVGSPTSSSTHVTLPEPSPTPVPLCENQYFPSRLGDTWKYSGTNTATGDYNRTDTVSRSGAEVFNVDSTISGITNGVNYGCTSDGLTANNPIQQYAGALLSGPNAPVNVKLTSVSGITLPAHIAPGDTWQQSADFEATSQQLNVSGRFVFDYTAIGFESITVPGGTFDALRMDATIHVEVSAFRLEAGTYTVSTWLAPDVGLVKSEGTSHVSGVDLSDSMQLTSFTPAP